MNFGLLEFNQASEVESKVPEWRKKSKSDSQCANLGMNNHVGAIANIWTPNVAASLIELALLI